MNRKIRLCLVINRFVVGGAETVVLDVARNLAPSRYEVTVLAPLEPREPAFSEMRSRFRDAGVDTHVLHLESYRSPAAIWRLYRFLKQGRFDIVHGHNRFSDAWAVRVGAWAGVPLLFWTRHLVYRDMSPAQIRRYRKLSRSVQQVIAVSDTVRSACIEIEGISPDKVVTLPNGIDTERFRPLPAEARNRKREEMGFGNRDHLLLFVGRMAEQKAPDAFVRLVRRVREQVPSARALMCGRGPLTEEIAAMADDGTGGVRVLGLRHDVPELLGAADLFVSTSRVEGLPLNVMEAMSTGLPFVGPDIGQISEMLTDWLRRDCLYQPPPTAGEVPDRVIDVWAERVVRALSDRERAVDLGRQCRNIIRESYSLETHIARQDRLYMDHCARLEHR